MNPSRIVYWIFFHALIAAVVAVPSGYRTLAANEQPEPTIDSVARPGGLTLPAEASTDWWTIAWQNIEESEYRITRSDPTGSENPNGAWQAPNRAHGFRTYFGERGITVVSRIEDQPEWQVGFELVSVGRESDRAAVSDAALSVRDNQSVYERALVREWYVNDSRGLKQGFVVHDPSAGNSRPSFLESNEAEPEPAAVSLDLRITGSLSAYLTADRQAVTFKSATNRRVLRYGELIAFDATGRGLPMHVEIVSLPEGSGLRLVVDDRAAVYPITIDPLLTTGNWDHESDVASAHLGQSVFTAGDVDGNGYSDVIVGAYGFDGGTPEQGRVFVFYGSPSGLQATPDWIAENNGGGIQFGYAVATAGDVDGNGFSDVIVGAPDNQDAMTGVGQVYVFHGSSSGLDADGSRPVGSPALADWSFVGFRTGMHLGASVGSAGDIDGNGYSDVIFGAPDFTGSGPLENFIGRAYVCYGGTGGLGSLWYKSGEDNGDHFGTSVATAGDVDGDGFSEILVGAPSVYQGGQSNAGLVYLYFGSSTGVSTAPPVELGLGQAGARFGSAVSTAGDLNGDGFADFLAGAPFYSNGQTNEGRVNIYLGPSSSVFPWPTYGLQSNLVNTELGSSLAPAGDTDGDGYADIIIGAPAYSNGEAGEGRIYLLRGGPGGFQPGAETVESDSAAAAFGASVGPAGDVNGDGFADVIVGAPDYSAGQALEGKAFVFEGSPSIPPTVADLTIDGDGGFLGNDRFGSSAASAGDINGDGYTDLIVGAPWFENGEYFEGAAYVYYGTAAGLPTTWDWKIEGNQQDANLGSIVASAGDVNGDGYSDVLITRESAGVFVFHGSVTGLTPGATLADADWTTTNPRGAHAGDVNGDGFSDLIVARTGEVSVYHGSVDGLLESPSWTRDEGHSFYGTAVNTVGDVNADGYSDVIATARDNFAFPDGDSVAWVYLGSESGIETGPAVWSEYVSTGTGVTSYGQTAAPSGDLDGDGYSDFLVGEWTGGTSGIAHVYFGSATGVDTSREARAATCGASTASIGRSVAGAGDVDGDGRSDMIIGADRAGLGGYAYINFGGSYSSTPAPRFYCSGWGRYGADPDAQFGLTVASAGDLNNDGFADVIVASPGLEPGRVEIFFGNDGARASFPEQRRSDDSLAILPQGASDSGDSLRLALEGWTTFGRAPIAMEWEIEPLGTLFDGEDTDLTTWQDSGTGGISFNELLTGLSEGPSYHWRTRVRYDPASVPFASHGRWFSLVENGWEEADLRMPECVDNDGDGYGTGTVNDRCSGGTDVDCDDASDAIYPGAPQVCDGLNNDCDHPSHPYLNGTNEGDDDTDGFSECQGDCEDTNSAIYPGALQICDGFNNDCSHPSYPYLNGTNEVDDDSDGYSECAGDSNDADPEINPDATETCDGRDNDSDGATDEVCDGVCDGPENNGGDVRVTADPGSFSYASLVWTGNEYGVSWHDERDGNDEIYFARIDASGNKIGDDVRVTHDSAVFFAPSMVWTGSDYGLSWEDRRNGNPEICFARLDASGNKIGDDVRVTADLANSSTPSLVWTGTEYGVAWHEERDGNDEVYFARLDASGNKIGDDVRVTDEPARSHVTSLVWTGSEYGISWEDDREGNRQVYFARLDASGGKIGGNVRVSDAPNSSHQPSLVWTGSEYGVLWYDGRDGNVELYFARFDGSGSKIGDDVRVTDDPNLSYAPTLVWTGSEYGVSWFDDRNGNNDIYFARLDGSGGKIGGDVRLTDHPSSSVGPSLAWTGSEYGVSWSDDRNGNNDIYFARLRCCDDADADGYSECAGDSNDVDPAINPGATEICDGLDNNSDGAIDEVCDRACDSPEPAEDDLPLTADPATSNDSSLTWTGSEYGVSWHDDRNGNFEIYFARLDASGDMIGADNRITNAIGGSYYPSIVWTGVEYGVSWHDNRTANFEIYFTRLDSAGNKIGADMQITNTSASSLRPSLVWTGGEYGVVWDDFRDGNWETYFARLDALGNKIGQDLRITDTPQSSQDPSLVWNGGEYGVAWDDLRNGNWEIYFARLDALGNKIGAELRVTDFAGSSLHSSLVWTGSEYGVAWGDVRDGNWEIYLARLDSLGNQVGSDRRVTDDPHTSQWPSLVWTGGEYGVSWHDDRAGNEEIYFVRLDALGNTIGTDLRVTDALQTSQHSSLVWTGSELGVSWHDDRDGDDEIYFARLLCCDDVDGDTFTECRECDDADGQVWETPGEARTLLFAGDRETLSWNPPLDLGGTFVVYDMLRTGDFRDFGPAPAECVESDDGSNTVATDNDPPPAAGEVYYYLVRAENTCPVGHGSLGERFDGDRPAGRDCP